MERAHATGVGTDIAVAESFVVLGGRHDVEVGAVAEREDRHLGTEESLLEQHLAPASPNRPSTRISLIASARLVAGLGDDHALAGGEAARLDDRDGVERREVGEGRVGVGEGRRGAGGDPMTQQEVLAVRLRAFE